MTATRTSAEAALVTRFRRACEREYQRADIYPWWAHARYALTTDSRLVALACPTNDSRVVAVAEYDDDADDYQSLSSLLHPALLKMARGRATTASAYNGVHMGAALDAMRRVAHGARTGAIQTVDIGADLRYGLTVFRSTTRGDLMYAQAGIPAQRASADAAGRVRMPLGRLHAFASIQWDVRIYQRIGGAALDGLVLHGDDYAVYFLAPAIRRAERFLPEVTA